MTLDPSVIIPLRTNFSLGRCEADFPLASPDGFRYIFLPLLRTNHQIAVIKTNNKAGSIALYASIDSVSAIREESGMLIEYGGLPEAITPLNDVPFTCFALVASGLAKWHVTYTGRNDR